MSHHFQKCVNGLIDLLKCAVVSVNYLSGFVQFNATLDAGDPAMVIQEIGLLNDDGVLMYRKVIPAVNKVSGTTYALAYKIKVQ